MGGFEIIEHTADVGIRAWGDSPEGLFTETTLGLLDIVGAWKPGAGEAQQIEVEARDRGGLLVDWLEEVLYLQDARDAVIRSVEVHEVGETRAAGTVSLGPRGEEILSGTAVKAITFHRLKVQLEGDRWVAEVYVDV
jgi:SHS2 domain-containing protein